MATFVGKVKGITKFDDENLVIIVTTPAGMKKFMMSGTYSGGEICFTKPVRLNGQAIKIRINPAETIYGEYVADTNSNRYAGNITNCYNKN